MIYKVLYQERLLKIKKDCFLISTDAIQGHRYFSCGRLDFEMVYGGVPVSFHGGGVLLNKTCHRGCQIFLS